MERKKVGMILSTVPKSCRKWMNYVPDPEHHHDVSETAIATYINTRVARSQGDFIFFLSFILCLFYISLIQKWLPQTCLDLLANVLPRLSIAEQTIKNSLLLPTLAWHPSGAKTRLFLSSMLSNVIITIGRYMGARKILTRQF